MSQNQRKSAQSASSAFYSESENMIFKYVLTVRAIKKSKRAKESFTTLPQELDKPAARKPHFRCQYEHMKEYDGRLVLQRWFQVSRSFRKVLRRWERYAR